MIFLWSREDGRPSNSSDIPPNMAGSIVKHMKSQCPMVRISFNSRQITMIPWDFSRRPMACSWGARWSQLYRWALVWAPLPQWKLWCWASCWAPHLGVWIHDPWRWENQLENPWKSWKSSGNTRKILEIHLQVYSRYTSNWQTARTEMLCALKSLFFFREYWHEEKVKMGQDVPSSGVNDEPSSAADWSWNWLFRCFCSLDTPHMSG